MASELEPITTRNYEGPDAWATMLEPIARVSQLIAPTEFVPRAYRGKPASVAAAILTGRGLGFDPMTSLRVLNVIEGQVSMSADAMLGRCQRAGHSVEWLENTDKAAELRMTRGDGLGSAHVRYTMRDAERAGDAGKRNYQRYPRAMLRARAITECVRMIAADILLGIDAGDTLDEHPPTQGEPAAGTVRIQTRERSAEPETSSAHTVTYDEDPHPLGDSHDITEHIVESEPDDGLVTKNQLRMLNAQISELEHLQGKHYTRDERRSIIAIHAGAAGIESALQLTREQASTAIDAIQAMLTPPHEGGEDDGE